MYINPCEAKCKIKTKQTMQRVRRNEQTGIAGMGTTQSTFNEYNRFVAVVVEVIVTGKFHKSAPGMN